MWMANTEEGMVIMFIGRGKELDNLEKRWKKGSFECVVVYGRRRIGKTTLIRRFCEGRAAIFTSAIESSIGENLKIIDAAVALYATGVDISDSAAGFPDFEAALETIFRLAQRERIIWVIDEYPYLAQSDPSVSSRLQHAIDRYKDNSKLMLILSGSSMSFMERQVLGYKSPLYGRRTSQMKIEPFDFLESLEYLKGMDAEEGAAVYGITNGIPQYLAQFDPAVTLADNIRDNVIDTSAFLFEEPMNLMQQELRKPMEYNNVIRAIASGHSRLNEIATASHMDTSLLVSYVNNLIDLGIVGRQTPFGHEKSRRPLYHIVDGFFRFWYSLVAPRLSLIQAGQIDLAMNGIMAAMSRFMGPVFENMCRQWLWSCNGADDPLPFPIAEMGRWWGPDPASHRQEEIDIVARGLDEHDGASRGMLFCECKWRNGLVGMEELELLRRRATLLHPEEAYYCLFSKSGFDQTLRDAAADDGRISLVSFADMTERPLRPR